MGFKIVVLWTDALLFLLLTTGVFFAVWARKQPAIRSAWRQVMRNRLALFSLLILLSFLSIALLDSLHYRPQLSGNGVNGEIHYATQLKSAFDALVSPLGDHYEKTYSAPFATQLFVKEAVEKMDGSVVRVNPPLHYVVADNGWHSVRTIANSTFWITVSWLLALIILVALISWHKQQAIKSVFTQLVFNQSHIPWRFCALSTLVIGLLIFSSMQLAQHYHILGTDKIGQDVFYQTLKSIRTGLLIGTLTTLIMLPFSIIFGIMAGYFGGWVDDVIQYLYTTLSSIPSVLLIAAAVLSLQVFIANHPDLFPSLAQRADARLLALCIILGVTSWTGLCRLLRAETLKLRELDYIQAAVALGTSRLKILAKHVLPNLMHIVLIAVVLDFSMLVLAEAVLSYVGVGVDPSTTSWGNMINSARLELAREPVVWWPLLAAFVFMFMLVLAANLFSDAVRDAFDPRLRR